MSCEYVKTDSNQKLRRRIASSTIQMDTQQQNSAKLASVTFSSGAELVIPIPGQASALLWMWLAENKNLAKGGLAIVKGKDLLRIRLYSGTLTDLEDAKNYINANMTA